MLSAGQLEHGMSSQGQQEPRQLLREGAGWEGGKGGMPGHNHQLHFGVNKKRCWLTSVSQSEKEQLFFYHLRVIAFLSSIKYRSCVVAAEKSHLQTRDWLNHHFSLP